MTGPEVAAEARAVVRRHRNGRGVGPLDLGALAGESLALMGPNGAGKTTLLRLLATLDRHDDGELRWWGSDDRTAARRLIGFCADVAVEAEVLTGRQATYFWCRQWTRDAAAARGQSARALELLGLGGVADEPVSTYSLGMRRRMFVAQALAHGPHLALLDEPTAGLDARGVDALVEIVRGRAGAGAATIVASNDPAFVARACDRVALIVDGCIVRCATPAALLAERGGDRVALVTLVRPDVPPAALAGPGVTSVDRDDEGGRLVARLRDPGALPAVVARAEAAGGLRDLSVREPDLADAFRNLTGRDLAASAR